MAKSNKKKITTAIVAGTTALALVLGGTFAWQSINQTALNEASDVINPGGRLHDDFNGSDKNVYVENFTDPANGGENIFARVRLDEYFEIVLNKGAGEGIEKTEVITAGAEKDNVDTYITHIFGGDNATDAYWSWTTGGQATYMPTFNKDKDSLDADINGTYEGTTIGDDVHYDDYEEIPSEKTADAVYDADADNLPDGDKAYVEETHYAADTLNATLISMDEWEDLGSPVGEYWVYDTDGWVYWAAPIAPGTATGLLLDEIALNDTMDDSWYYAINVVAQFITADDLGKTDGTGFYDTENGTVPSDRALALLEAIGVDVPGPVNEDGNGDDIDDMTYDLVLTADGSNSVAIAVGASIRVKVEDGISYDRFVLRQEYSDGETNDNTANVSEDGVFTLESDYSQSSQYYLIAQIGEEVYDEEYEEYWTDYTDVASAQLHVFERYVFRYNDEALKNQNIEVTVDELLNGIDFVIYDTVDDKEVDAQELTGVNFILSYSSGTGEQNTLGGDEYGMDFDGNTLNIETSYYDGGEYYEPHTLTAGDIFILTFEGEQELGEDEDGDMRYVRLMYSGEFTVTIVE